jgi:hypothetical protein
MLAWCYAGQVACSRQFDLLNQLTLAVHSSGNLYQANKVISVAKTIVALKSLFTNDAYDCA